jgi:drug/metabolite transporter (DMT)-like permease
MPSGVLPSSARVISQSPIAAKKKPRIEILPGMPSVNIEKTVGIAAIGLWLITRAEDGNTPEGIGLALFAGTGFAGFYLCVRQAGDASPFWIATLTRTGALVITGLIVLLQREFSDITAAGVRWGILTGCVDSIGTILFVRASQTGRLDEAVVISSLYPAVTVLLARLLLKEHFTRWRFVGLLAALAAVPMIAAG